jgi:hypothetical protein
LTGEAQAGRLSRVIKQFGVPTPYRKAEGETVGSVIASFRATLRGLRPHACVDTPCARTGRSPVCPPLMVWWDASGRL